MLRSTTYVQYDYYCTNYTREIIGVRTTVSGNMAEVDIASGKDLCARTANIALRLQERRVVGKARIYP